MNKVQCAICWKYVEHTKVSWFTVQREQLAQCEDCRVAYEEKKGKK